MEHLAQESRARFEGYMEDKKFSAETKKQLRQATDADPEWDRLYQMLVTKEGMDDENARTALMMAMAVSTAYQAQYGATPRWVSLRRVVGVYLQNSPDLSSAMNGRYLSNDEEILAAAYAAQVPSEWTKPNHLRLGILDEPGPQEAAIQQVAWRDFSAQALPMWKPAGPSLNGWREQRKDVAITTPAPAPRSARLGR